MTLVDARRGAVSPEHDTVAQVLRAARVSFPTGFLFGDLLELATSCRLGVTATALHEALDDLIVDAGGAFVREMTAGGYRFGFIHLARPMLASGRHRRVAAQTSTPKKGAQLVAPALREGAGSGDKDVSPWPSRRAAGARRATRPETIDVNEAKTSTRCVAPPRPDGGTSFRVVAQFTSWCPTLQELVTLAATSGKLPSLVALPLSDGCVLHAKVARVRGTVGVDLLFAQRATLRLLPKLDLVLLETKAHALWSNGVEAWMNTWFDRVSSWVMGVRCHDVRAAAAAGWQVDHLELASDFVGLNFQNNDVQLFTGRRGKRSTIRSTGGDVLGEADTVEIGHRGRDRLAIETHNKSKLLRKDKTVPSESVFADTWREFGWDGNEEIRRVEVRAHGTALTLRSGAGDELTLSDPTMLLDVAAVTAFWRHATRARRLVALPSSGNLRSLSRRPTDPRWVAVQEAGGGEQDAVGTYAQVRRSNRDATETRRRARARAARELGRYVAIERARGGGRSLQSILLDLELDLEFRDAVDLGSYLDDETIVEQVPPSGGTNQTGALTSGSG